MPKKAKTLSKLIIAVNKSQTQMQIVYQPNSWRGCGTVYDKNGLCVESISCPEYQDGPAIDFLYVQGADYDKDLNVLEITPATVQKLKRHGVTIKTVSKFKKEKKTRELRLDTLDYTISFKEMGMAVGCQFISKKDALKLFKEMGKYLDYEVEK